MNLAFDSSSCKLIHGLRKVGRVEEAVEKFEEISEKGLVPDVVIYNIMIGGLCKKGMLMEAYRLFMQMEEKGCLPDSMLFNVIIQSFLRKKNVKKVMELIEAMRKRKFSPNDAVASMLLELVLSDSHFHSYLNSLPNFVKENLSEKHHSIWINSATSIPS